MPAFITSYQRQPSCYRSGVFRTGTIAFPIGHGARPASFRCAQANGMPTMVRASRIAVTRWPGANHSARSSHTMLPITPQRRSRATNISAAKMSAPAPLAEEAFWTELWDYDDESVRVRRCARVFFLARFALGPRYLPTTRLTTMAAMPASTALAIGDDRMSAIGLDPDAC
jgi:hypothetical protein